MFDITFLIIIAIYFLLVFFVATGAGKKYPRLGREALPLASVIVAARNEEKNIESCLISLSKLSYPNNKLEIIIVDDESSDDTPGIINRFIKDKPLFKKVSSLSGYPALKGKVKALDAGIEASRGEIILLTDADCTVPETWACSIASYYHEGTGMVNGFTTQKAYNWFSGMQAIDFVFLISVAAGMTNNNRAVSCIGNNMSFRKQAYIDTGGYRALPFSVTEDFALLKAIRKLNKYKIIHPAEPAALVVSLPEDSFGDLINQKKRWAAGGADAPPEGMLVMAAAFLANLFTSLTPLFFSTVSLYLAVFKIAVDAFFLYPVLKHLKLNNNLKYFFSFQLYYTIYIIFLPFILLFSGKIKWKGREYSFGK